MHESKEAALLAAYHEGYHEGYRQGREDARPPATWTYRPPLPASAAVPRPALEESSYWLGYYHGRYHARTGAAPPAARAAGLVPPDLEGG